MRHLRRDERMLLAQNPLSSPGERGQGVRGGQPITPKHSTIPLPIPSQANFPLGSKMRHFVAEGELKISFRARTLYRCRNAGFVNHRF